MKSVMFNDGGHMVKIDGHILDLIFQYRQAELFQREVGGILIGRELESTDNLIIEEMTEPMSSDRQSRFRFERKDPAHMSRFQELYTMSGETYGYFGEWHTHPEKVPKYSGIDKRNWSKLYNGLPQPHALYFVIGGTVAVGVWKMDLTESSLPIYLFGNDWHGLNIEERHCEE